MLGSMKQNELAVWLGFQTTRNLFADGSTQPD